MNLADPATWTAEKLRSTYPDQPEPSARGPCDQHRRQHGGRPTTPAAPPNRGLALGRGRRRLAGQGRTV